ncbi:hypothetical protein LMG28688_00640 [Paraburkholderia caffeinitolerans]|uniref:Uncharacterized protein n=1 Tax=Paraburkholderia caffeinitolerans TaxID=1723730 RepID=A0A6J5FI95_9BURK|nr:MULTISPECIES: DUF6402 family protein [Paraburkholderia]CAB3778939.1 hypothetical protein LMG28688_00640 [Paraburkholderia caffeinitolerans]
MYLIDGEIPYYKTSIWGSKWSKCDGCKPVDVQRISVPGISMDKAPPPAPKPAKAQSSPQKEVIKVPPFDIQEIPDAMRREAMPVAAQLMTRWFAGELNYAPTGEDLKAERNQDGEPYPSTMYDITTVKMSWILKFERAKEQYNELIKNRIYNQAAISVLRERLVPYRDFIVPMKIWDICKNNMPILHRYFHFQRVNVGSSLAQKIDEFMESQFHRNGIPDDLTGALGSFNLYAAPADVKIDYVTREAVISSVYVYVKDSYDFTDEAGSVSQYLGHWSTKGVIVVPYHGLIQQLNIWSLYVPYPVARGNVRVKGNIYYPVHNKDFRAWAIKHQRGGDFMVFSDRKRCQLRVPIRIKL